MSVSVGEQDRVGSQAHGPPEAVLVEGGVENLLPGRAIHLLPRMEDLLQRQELTQGTKQGRLKVRAASPRARDKA